LFSEAHEYERQVYGSMRQDPSMFRHIRAVDKGNVPTPHSLQDRNAEEWFDREIARLRQSVEDEAQGQAVHERGAAARPRRAFRWRVAIPGRRGIAPGASRLPWGPISLLRQTQRFVRRRRFEIALYGLGIGISVVVAWLIAH
jgi:hypothetical protein